MSRVRDRLAHPWLTVRVQIALGIIFVVAAWGKIADPPGFAHEIYNYKLVSPWALNAIALGLPWLELLCGLALILGVWRRTAATLVGALLVVFILAIGVNLARDNAVNCGCFGVSTAPKTHDQLLTEMKLVILRDLGMLLMVAQILYATRTARGTRNVEAAQLSAAHSSELASEATMPASRPTA